MSTDGSEVELALAVPGETALFVLLFALVLQVLPTSCCTMLEIVCVSSELIAGAAYRGRVIGG